MRWREMGTPSRCSRAVTRTRSPEVERIGQQPLGTLGFVEILVGRRPPDQCEGKGESEGEGWGLAHRATGWSARTRRACGHYVAASLPQMNHDLWNESVPTSVVEVPHLRCGGATAWHSGTPTSQPVRIAAGVSRALTLALRQLRPRASWCV